ncbi:MAG: TSUP family transporter [Oscillospiraceae bacterium]
MTALIIAAFLTGIFASMGVGGGMILIIYLTVFAGYSQLEAQGINLVYFLPIAALALIIHTKNHLVEWKKALPAIICGVIAAVVGAFIAEQLGSDILRKIFGGFIFIIGIKEIFTAYRSSPRDQGSHAVGKLR